MIKNQDWKYWELHSTMGKMFAGFDEEGVLRQLDFLKEEEIPIITKTSEESKLPEYLKKLQTELDEYEKGQRQSFDIPIRAEGTSFAKLVWEELLKIPFGETISYGELAKIIGAKLDKEKMSAQAIGQAVGKNPIAIIIPCHRVIGAKGQLTGYAGGIDRKVALLNIENYKNIKNPNNIERS